MLYLANLLIEEKYCKKRHSWWTLSAGVSQHKN